MKDKFIGTKQTSFGFGIVIGTPRERHFALGGNGAGIFFTYKRKDAVAFKRELKQHLPKHQMAVVRVVATWEVKP
jgi:hypothetical protein